MNKPHPTAYLLLLAALLTSILCSLAAAAETPANAIKIEASQTRLKAGEAIGLTATLKKPATGKVTFTEQPGGWSQTALFNKDGVAMIPADDKHALRPTPGEHVITAAFNGLHDKVTVAAIKMKIATAPTIICPRKNSFTIKLTKDSYPGGPVVWKGLSGATGKGKSFTFNPSKQKKGKYTITASAVGHGHAKPVRDSVKIDITGWPIQNLQSAKIPFKLTLTAKKIKALGLSHIKVSFGKDTKHLKKQIENMIGPNDQKKLHDKWSAAKTGIPFKAWLNQQVNQANKRVIQRLDSAIKEVKEAKHNLSGPVYLSIEPDYLAKATTKKHGLPGQMDLLAKRVAIMASKRLTQTLRVEAVYTYSCGKFDRGQPGWGKPDMAKAGNESISGSLEWGFDTHVSIEMAGIKIGQIPLKATATIEVKVAIKGIKTSSPIWQPSAHQPAVTTKIVPIVELKISGKTDVQAPATVTIKGLTSRKLDSKAYPIKLKAKKTGEMTLHYHP